MGYDNKWVISYSIDPMLVHVPCTQASKNEQLYFLYPVPRPHVNRFPRILRMAQFLYPEPILHIQSNEGIIQGAKGACW